MAVDKSRRQFLGWSLGISASAAALGGLGIAVKSSLDPLPSVLASGVVKIDLNSFTINKPSVLQWRGKPIFVLKKDSSMPINTDRDVKIGEYFYSILIGSCTHLGCIPAWKKQEQLFACACHGGRFDSSGLNIFGPPPRPLDIPPFKIENDLLVLGETGMEYDNIMKSIGV